MDSNQKLVSVFENVTDAMDYITKILVAEPDIDMDDKDLLEAMKRYAIASSAMNDAVIHVLRARTERMVREVISKTPPEYIPPRDAGSDNG